MEFTPSSRLLIADTAPILEAFLDNGLHRDFAIYCQFPCHETLRQKAEQAHPLSIEFNDGMKITSPTTITCLKE
ncbi:hypothetical protein ACFFLZ_06855 [Photobacterium aphoticum]|uniref:Uncharacterized protein n=1 Tax=Photobacterium aphoticum TaxID=754436 RepID=A0A0J1GRM3_9GAMM|nr:hypothetical protein [Photobacterium aphoticum]KLV02069.1 hypothetical protein ABT58_06745 [Photobacterium aphoticum]PSU60318.1 hypothetical protein C9I90_01500 [Photobacterium aphoticum]GHA34871.1 hypothetical protein GCM10007086_05570 [Photobacterium aphoticum]